MVKVVLNLEKVKVVVDLPYYSDNESRVARIHEKMDAVTQSLLNEVEVKDDPNNIKTVVFGKEEQVISCLFYGKQEICLPSGEIRVGRDHERCALAVLNDLQVSRLHAVFTVKGSGAVKLRDVHSGNGTFVNGQRIEEVSLVPGDRIRLGETEFVAK